MEKDMEKVKNILMMVNLFLKENLKMEREIKEKNMMSIEVLYMKGNFQITKRVEKENYIYQMVF